MVMARARAEAEAARLGNDPPVIGEDNISMTWPQYLRNEVTYKGQRVHVPPTIAKLLLLFLLNRGKAIKLDAIIEFLWPNPDDEPTDEVSLVRAQLSNLRKRFPGILVTSGYRNGYILLKPGQRFNFPNGHDYAVRGKRAGNTKKRRHGRKSKSSGIVIG